MKKIILSACAFVFLFGNSAIAQTKENKSISKSAINSNPVIMTKNLHQFKVEDISAQEF